jgi:hypothetical protein
MPLMRGAAATAGLILTAIVVVATACGRDAPDTSCDLLVVNDTECTVVVFVDGARAFAVGPHSDRSLEEIGRGRHVLEATNSRGDLIERRLIDLSAGEDFVWTISHCP